MIQIPFHCCLFVAFRLTNWWYGHGQTPRNKNHAQNHAKQQQRMIHTEQLWNCYENLANKSQKWSIDAATKRSIREWHSIGRDRWTSIKVYRLIWFGARCVFHCVRSEHSICKLHLHLALWVWVHVKRDRSQRSGNWRFCFCYGRIDNCLITSFARNCNVQSHFVE